MDGDIAVLPELIEVARRHDCLIMVDEAHSFGVLGAHGFGIRELFGLAPDAVDIWMGTLSKSLASYGGFLAVSTDVAEALRMSAAGLNMFAAGSPPPQMAAAIAAFDIMEREPERLERLLANGRNFAESATAAGLDIGPSHGTPIVPVMYGSTQSAVIAAVALAKAGINANPITYPAVAEQDARIRFFINCDHTEEQIEQTVAAVVTAPRTL